MLRAAAAAPAASHAALLAAAAAARDVHQFAWLLQEEWMWLTGVLLTLLGTTLIGAGLLMQRYAHLPAPPPSAPSSLRSLPGSGSFSSPPSSGSDMGSPGGPNRKRPRAAAGPRWAVLGAGTAVYALGHVACWLGLGFAPLTVTVCLGCCSTLVTLALAPVLLGEAATRGGLLSIPLLLAGCVLVVGFGPRGYEAQTPATIAKAWGDYAFLAAFAATCVFLLAMAALAGVRRCLGGPRSFAPLLSPLQHTLVAAVLAWYAVLFSKCTAGLAVASLKSGENQLKSWVFWTQVLAMLVSALLNVYHLRLGLAGEQARVVAPVYEVSSMSGGLLIGVLFFGELRGAPLVVQLPFWLGACLVLAGVTVVAACHGAAIDEDDDATRPLGPPPAGARA